MRENKFRGKVIGKQEELEAMGVIDKNGWATGNLIQNEQHTMIVGDLLEFDDEDMICDWWVPVIPESVGQYTGLKDKNDVEICEGDVVLIESRFLGTWAKSEVTWGGPNYPAFDIPKFDGDVMNGFSAIAYTDYGETLKVIGNIHDNQELLEVNK
ncbi:YopX family protein [Carnobacterium maltaromaticum]|uniref:YopX family protein n=1 Tax=Carnobacterium maltaromaticum TaxID=2751 RepID=UPI00295E4E23|nr:YopX family protein [Carnobacterium maltaromaticum]